MNYLSAEEILFIHYTMMDFYEDSDQAGIKNQDRFEGMVARPKTTLYGVETFPTVIEKACCYYHSIARGGHIFQNGNKRTALTVLETFLNINGLELIWSEQQAEDFTVYVANDDRFKDNDCIHFLKEELEAFIHPLKDPL
ncbi:type II toxin-antitoxin system death-on-curing family toxin [Jeotgalibacillus proteolyticus]|uniref:Type II toxin-antitoxin system death-on-curing family toxin n=1 Tax=Jeotgalibacillus proteolyticus TaxID=2082395 RepID=A0A2S5G7A4_9BACL|nr:type II toxin-antitoxin system death-on-curing family toxin [Jeotgalibacillus proteolyticus]PPA68814.1 type II toxin-antitoxin system death-on-curing family toxin [Jeotgalibacillus proteolyticus]PPA68820.1 type II toxin-antitoxin system death-on-curing family toxin [Jeotgalibacillus proteolyticus]